MPFGELFDWKGKSKIKSGDGSIVGKYKMFVCSDSETKRYDEFLENAESIVFGTGGKASCHYANEPFAYSTDCIVAQPKSDKIYVKFYYYYFRQNNLSEIQKTFTGSGLQHTSKKKIESISVPLPEASEQQRIVAKIEELFSKLDKGVEELNKIKEQLKIYRQAVLKETYNLSDDKIKLEDLCFFITKGTTPPKNSTENNRAKEIPFLKVYNLTFNGQLDFSIDPTFVTKETHTGFLNRSICLPGDVLMNIVGPPIGKVSIVPNTYSEWNINQAIVRYRCLEKLNNKFLAYFLLFSNTVEQLKSKGKATAGQFNLTLEICRELQIPLPTIEKQIEIVDCIEQKLSVCDKIEQTVNESLQKAKSLRQSILKQAFEGKLV